MRLISAPVSTKLGDGTKRLWGRARMAEPAGVHRNGRQEPVCDFGCDRGAKGMESADDQAAGGLRGRVLEEDRSQVIVADVMIDHHARPGEVTDEIRHVAELVPGREVQDHQDFAIGEGGGGDLLPEVLEQAPVRVEGWKS